MPRARADGGCGEEAGKTAAARLRPEVVRHQRLAARQHQRQARAIDCRPRRRLRVDPRAGLYGSRSQEGQGSPVQPLTCEMVRCTRADG